MSEVTNVDVLVERIEGVTQLINEKFTDNEKSHSAILAQTCKVETQVARTNGRVNGLENFKNQVIGALIMMNIIILPVAFIIISNWINNK